MYLNLGANISRNKKLQEENNFCETIKILWTYKTSVHKATVTAISNIAHLALLTLNLNNVFEDLKQIQETILWENKTVKVKNMHQL